MSESAPRFGSSQELDFQDHVRDYLVARQGYARLDMSAIDEPELALSRTELLAYLAATQTDSLARLGEDYGSDAGAEVVKALREALTKRPLWMILRHGLEVRGNELKLFSPLARSREALGTSTWGLNRWAVLPHFRFGATYREIDLVIYLNGLPIVTVELKHEAAGQTWANAVAQYIGRDHGEPIFRLPFLHIAADTTQVKMATDPRAEANFRWLNAEMENRAETDGEYPVEHLYRDVLSPRELTEDLSFFLIHVPAREASPGISSRPAYSIFPRYHQSRMVRKVAEKARAQFTTTGTIGGKYLIDHSAGSGKTLSICWLADRIHGLYDTAIGKKLTDLVFVLTDRRSLDKNIRDEIENFIHLKDVAGIARRSRELVDFLGKRRPIIVTTQQKFAWILETIERDSSLRELRVAFLIDEAHRSQEGKLGLAIRKPFRNSTDAYAEDEVVDEDEGVDEEAIAAAIRRFDRNQLFVAFTATPSPATIQLFGAPFDRYSEDQAIAEGYVVDVAKSIISYSTLYNLRSTAALRDDTLYPKGLIARALQRVAYEDDELIQYKAEVMLRHYEESVRHLIGGRAKAMIVASSRVAGLRYHRILAEKLRERGAPYKTLYAFSDFEYRETPESQAISITEHDLNRLKDGEAIEDRFESDEYRIMVVANKFQTGYSQPLFAAMFLDKTVSGRNAIQTVSRLNRAAPGKDTVLVVDFTNNALDILKAFRSYRSGGAAEPREPEASDCVDLYRELIARAAFAPADVITFEALRSPRGNPRSQSYIQDFRFRFEKRFPALRERRDLVTLMATFVERFGFLSCFFDFSPKIVAAARFAEQLGPQLLRVSTATEFASQISGIRGDRATVHDHGNIDMPDGKGRQGPRRGGGHGSPPPRVTIAELINELRTRFPISEEEALCIREVTEEKLADEVIASEVKANRDNRDFLDTRYKSNLNSDIQLAYTERGRLLELVDPKYIGAGGIFDFMAYTVIDFFLYREAV